MIARPIQFTASGQIEAGRVYCAGGAIDGMTKVLLYDGNPGAGGTLIGRLDPGSDHFGYEIIANNGLWATVSGAGTGVVWLV